MITPEQLVHDAIEEFKSTLDERKLSQFARTTVTQIKRRIIDIQTSHETFKTIVGLNRLGSFLDAWEKFDSCCNTLAVGESPLSGFIWGPLNWILRVAGEDAKILDCILQSYLVLGDRLVPISQQSARFGEHAFLRKCLAWMYHDLLVFHGYILKLFEPRDWRATFEVQWNDLNDRDLLKFLLDSFQRNGECIERTLHEQSQNDIRRRLNDHVSRYGIDMDHIMQCIAQYEEDRERYLAAAKEAEDARRHTQYLEVLSWLRSPTESEKQRHDVFQFMRSPDTGMWLMNEDKVSYWMNLDTPPHSILWIQGFKGAGKTILTSLIIDQLIETYPEDTTGTTTSYFYCRSGDERSGEGFYLMILKSLIRQIISRKKDLLATLHNRRVNGRNGVEILDDVSTANALLKLLCNAPGRHFFVIDGLDEMERSERKAVVQCLSTIVQRSDGYDPGRIRVLLVSTDLDDLRAHAKAVDNLEIYDIEARMMQKDIDIYLQKCSVDLKARFHLSDEDAAKARDMILEKSQGMFLYAFLVSENLLRQTSGRRYLEQLESSRFPGDLAAAYDRIIERLKTENTNTWEEAKRIFMWLCCATRPLKCHELQAVLSMHIDEQGVLHHSQADRACIDIREICGSLIRVIGNSVFFVHETVSRHVLQNEHMDRDTLETDASLFCLSYLSHDCFHQGDNQDSIKSYVDQGIFAFQDYAAARWDLHLTHMITVSAGVFRGFGIGREYQIKAAMVLERFLLLYGSDVGVNTTNRTGEVDWLARARSQGQPIQDLLFHDTLVPIWAHMLRHREQAIAKRHQVSLSSLGMALDQTRPLIREWSSKHENPLLAEEYYGANLHKCSRATCAFFYDGFSSEEALKHHLNRHERPYACPFEATCSSAPFGFASNRDKDRHVRIYHPDDPETERAVVSSQSGSPDGSGGQTPEGRGPRHQCEQCGQRFTRRGALTSHMNSAHLGRRPYECSICGRAFTRSNDMRRHERTIHRRMRAEGLG